MAIVKQMETKLIDAVRTMGQLLLHNPCTGFFAKDEDGDWVYPNEPEACSFCYLGAQWAVSGNLQVSEDKLKTVATKALNRKHPLTGDDWDSATDEKRAYWANKLANFKG